MKLDNESQKKFEEMIDELAETKLELLKQKGEKDKLLSMLMVAKDDKSKRIAELLLAKEETAKQAAEVLILQYILDGNIKNEMRAAELLVVKDELYIEKQLLEKTLMSIGDAVISTDKNSNIIFLNRVAESLTGWSMEEAFGKSIYDVFKIVNEFTKEKAEDIVKEVFLSHEVQILSNYVLLITKNKEEILIEDSASPILDEHNKVVGVVIIFRDYRDKSDKIKQIEHMSFHDDLTGLFNRRFYEAELERIDTTRNLPISLIMGDVNGLKLINDSFGHKVGDQLLVKATNAIKQGCRNDDLIARIGGDEFIVLMPNTNEEEAANVIQRIHTHSELEKINGLDISISFGSCTKTEFNQNIQELFELAENKMYKQKLYESTSMRNRTIELISNTLFAKSRRELLHSQKVSEFCEIFAKIMGFNAIKIKITKLAGLMHDIGKIGIDDIVLNKNGKLDTDEYLEIKKHPEIGYKILNSVKEFAEVSECVLQHHENWDGSGYPQGLKGNQIKIESRIISIVDTFAAMTNERTYRKTMSNKTAVDEILKASGTQFDPALVKIFIENFDQFEAV